MSAPSLPADEQHQGWEYYSLAPFKEDLKKIIRLVGNQCYSWMEYDGHIWVRRDEGEED
jgi:hypothetical protein